MIAKPSREEQKQTLLALARQRAPRPLLIGHGAVHLGWWATLNDTEDILEELVKEGVLRHATRPECRWFGIRFGYLLV